MKKLIQNAYKEMDPSQKQVGKMFNNILDRHENKNAKVIVVNHKKKILTTSVAVAACAALTICLGTSIYKNANKLNISKSGNSADVTVEEVLSATETTPDPVPVENNVITDIRYPYALHGYNKCYNGKRYYTSVENKESEYFLQNINLSDMTSETTQGSESYLFQRAFISGNTLYSIDCDYTNEKQFLCITDIASGEVTNKTEVDYLYNCIRTDRNGNIYLSSNYEDDQTIKIYSKELKLLYSISREDIIAKIGDNIKENYSDNMYISAMAVSPEGEIYIGFNSVRNSSVCICKLDSHHNMSYITDNFYDNGSEIDSLFLSENGNIIMCSTDFGDRISYINEISAQDGQLTRSLGNTGRVHAFGLYENNLMCMEYDTAANGYIFKFNIDDQSTEEIYSSGDDEGLISNALLNGNTLMLAYCNRHMGDDTTYLIVEDSDGNIERKLCLDSPLEVSFDVTSDEQIYYMTTEYNVVYEETESYANGIHSVYTINSDFQPEKLFDIDTSHLGHMAPVLSADTNGNIYINVTDQNTKSTLYIYDHSGNIKSTVDMPEVLQAVPNIIVSDSSDKIFVIGYDVSDNFYSVTVDPQTWQVEDVRNIDKTSSFIYEDGVAAFTDGTDDESEENTDSETQNAE